jgi:hypothetical protein
MSFPVGDPQFWCVSASAAAALWVAVRPFLGRPQPKGAGACATCSLAAGGRCAPPAGGRPGLVVLGRPH